MCLLNFSRDAWDVSVHIVRTIIWGKTIIYLSFEKFAITNNVKIKQEKIIVESQINRDGDAVLSNGASETTQHIV